MNGPAGGGTTAGGSPAPSACPPPPARRRSRGRGRSGLASAVSPPRGGRAGACGVPAVPGGEGCALAGRVAHRPRRQPAAGRTHRVTLAVLEEVLRDDTEFPPLPVTLELLGGPLDLQPQRRQAEAAAED